MIPPAGLVSRPTTFGDVRRGTRCNSKLLRSSIAPSRRAPSPPRPFAPRPFGTPRPFERPRSPVRVRRDGDHAVFSQLSAIVEDETPDGDPPPPNAPAIRLLLLLLLRRQPQHRRVPRAIVRGHLVVRNLVRREPPRDRDDSRIESHARTLVHVTVVVSPRKRNRLFFEGHSVAESKRELVFDDGRVEPPLEPKPTPLRRRKATDVLPAGTETFVAR